MSRKCDAIGCTRVTARGRFLCRAHWFAVPLRLRDTINERYRVCRADFRFLRDEQYLQAAVDAIDTVAKAEGKTGTNPYQRHLLLAQRSTTGVRVMNKPEFITFTGIDDQTNLVAAEALADDYPVEFGVLFSPDREGAHPRYPSRHLVDALFRMKPGRLAAHLCGGWSRQLLASAGTDIDSILARFGRIQVNTAHTGIDTAAMKAWADRLGAVEPDPDVPPWFAELEDDDHHEGPAVILQCRDFFPSDTNVQWLFDASGGRGISPAIWPKPGPCGEWSEPLLSGYAGGLNPTNVAAAVTSIGQHDERYWIDMESGVRDEADRFCLIRCRAVCEAVFGPPRGRQPHP